LESFARYTHAFTPPDRPCNPQSTLDSLQLPAVVVSQTGYGKKGFLQSLRGTLARRARPSVLVSYRDCVRGRSRTAPVDLQACLVEKVREETHASAADAANWLGDSTRYVVMFDAIDDSASREQVFQLIKILWQHQKGGGTVVVGSQPENLKYVLSRFGLEDWVVWLRDQIPAVDVRGININSVRRIATEYEEHQVAADDVSTVLDFPQQCPGAAAVVREWIAQPKLFREKGAHSVAPVAEAIRAGGPACRAWRGGVLNAMMRARFWSYCHDELCNYQTDGDRYLAVARRLRTVVTVTEAELAKLTKEQGFQNMDEVAFPLLSTGVLYVEAGALRVDPQWIPE